MRLDEHGADGAQIVGEADADAGFRARLGAGVDRRGERGRDRGAVHAPDIGPAVGGGGAGVLGVAGVGGGLRGHVLGPDETLDDLERAVASDGGDAARDREILPPGTSRGLDLGLDRVETRVDAFGLLDQLVRPLVLVHGGELVMAQAQLLDLGGLLGRRLAGLGMDAPEARGRAPVHLRHRLGPLPAGRELVGGRGELLDASSFSSAGSSSQTPFSCSSAKRSRSTRPPAAS